jgi:hypothetical protein
MDSSTLKQILQNSITQKEENMRIAMQIGNVEEALHIEQEVEETKLTLSQL